MKICRENPNLFKIEKKKPGTLYEDRSIFILLTAVRNILHVYNNENGTYCGIFSAAHNCFVLLIATLSSICRTLCCVLVTTMVTRSRHNAMLYVTTLPVWVHCCFYPVQYLMVSHFFPTWQWQGRQSDCWSHSRTGIRNAWKLCMDWAMHILDILQLLVS